MYLKIVHLAEKSQSRVKIRSDFTHKNSLAEVTIRSEANLRYLKSNYLETTTYLQPQPCFYISIFGWGD